MCQDSAVQWSEYESHKRNLESEVKNTLTERVRKAIEIAYDSGESQDFIQGLSYSLGLIQNNEPAHEKQKTDPREDRLF